MLADLADYEEVKDLPNHPEKLLIDVREPKEIQETGQIPTSINIPCKYRYRSNSIIWLIKNLVEIDFLIAGFVKQLHRY